MAARTKSQSEEVALPYTYLTRENPNGCRGGPSRVSAWPRYTFNHAMNPRASAAAERSTVLDVGCGTRKAEADALGIDRSPGPETDIVWDLDHYPWPLESGRFERIHLSHIIEHVQDVMATMGEVHRVARAGASVFVTTPHLARTIRTPIRRMCGIWRPPVSNI